MAAKSVILSLCSISTERRKEKGVPQELPRAQLGKNASPTGTRMGADGTGLDRSTAPSLGGPTAQGPVLRPNNVPEGKQLDCELRTYDP